MNYGKAFRIIRAAFGLSQAELARLLEIGQSQVSLIESGRRQPSHSVIDALADTLRIPIPLITVLSFEPSDLEAQDQPVTEMLALSLLKLLVSASESEVQPPLPFLDETNDE